MTTIETKPTQTTRVSRLLSWSLAGLLAGCAVADGQDAPGLSLRFAALDGGCQPTTNGTNAVPEAIDTLVVIMQAAGEEPRTVRASRASVAQTGSWLIKGIPVTEDLDIKVYGCDAAGEVTYAGQSNDARIESQQESTLRAFLLPVNKVVCTGDDGLDNGSGARTAGNVPAAAAGLPKAAALAQSAAMASGDVLVAGGIGEWSADKKQGVATRETAVYDHRTGHFRRGPLMRESRVWHSVIAVDAHHVLVAGGVGNVDAIGSTSGVTTPVLVPNDISKALAKEKAELIDVRLDENGQPKLSAASAVDVGAGANLLSSAIRVGEEIVYVGGVDAAGAAVTDATRVTGLTDIAAGKAGTTTAVQMAVARVSPGLVALDDGRVLIWGGSVNGKADDMGEVLNPGSDKTLKLKISGDADLLKSTTLTTAGPAVALLSQNTTQAVLLVAGGMPFSSPLSASDAPTYLVVFNRASGEAVIKPATVAGKPVHGGLGTVLTRTPSGQVVMAGGLVALSAQAPCAATAAECLLSQVLLIDPPTDVSAATVDLTAEVTLDLGGGQFGISAAPLPMGVLLAGGQSAVVAKVTSPASALTTTSRVLVPSPADAATICGK